MFKTVSMEEIFILEKERLLEFFMCVRCRQKNPVIKDIILHHEILLSDAKL